MTEPWSDWKATEPSANFTDKVMDAVAKERAKSRSWRMPIAIGSVAAAAALAGLSIALRPTSGSIVAEARKEVQISRHVVAVLEPGSVIAWNGAHIEQKQGDVFYRVDKGTPLEVETALGKVTVGGTCFRVRLDDQNSKKGEAMKYGSQVASLAAGIVVTAIVYEGRVALASKTGKKVDIQAGEGARADNFGDVIKLSDGDKRDPKLVPGTPGFDWNKAVAGYQKELAEVEEKKTEVERELAEAKKALAKAGGDAGRGDRSDFDLSQEDWRALKEKGLVKYQVPCTRPNWTPSATELARLALAPEDGDALVQAYAQSKARLWSSIGPLCVKAVGNAQLAEMLGSDSCTHLIFNMEASGKNGDKTISESFDVVHNIRSGEMAEPSGQDRSKLNPVAQIFLTLTAESKQFERDLAEKLGPEEAHRVTYDKNMCMGKSTFGNKKDDK